MPLFNKKGAVTMKAKTKLITVIFALSAACAFAADWPQYYGPKRDSTSTEKGIMRSWPKEGPNVLWTTPVGIGYGGPAVSAGKVYLLDRDDKVGDKLRCLDLASGKELWNFAYDAPGRFDHPGSRTYRQWMAITFIPADRLETCIASARPRTSPSGIRTSGRISVAEPAFPPISEMPDPVKVRCLYGE